MRKANYIIATNHIRIDVMSTTHTQNDGILNTDSVSRMVRTELASVFLMAVNNSRVTRDIHMSMESYAPFMRFRIDHASSPVDANSPKSTTRHLVWVFYESSTLHGEPICPYIVVMRKGADDDVVYDHTVYDPSNAYFEIKLDLSNKEKTKEDLKKVVEYIRIHLKEAFDLDI